MTYGKLPGVYFTESVSRITTPTAKAPLFIVESATALATVDDQLVSYINLDAFKAVFTAKAFEPIVTFISNALTEAGLQNARFYVYKATAGTTSSFSSILVDSSNVDEIEDVFYLEGVTGTEQSTLENKVKGLKAGAATCYLNGVNRICYIIPQKTIEAAIADKTEGQTDEAAVVAKFSELTTGVDSGRIAYILPDDGDIISGRVIDSDYNEEVGYYAFNTAASTPTYNFNYSQMVTLQDGGVMFIRGERLRGSVVYRVNLGVSTSFATNAADGLLVCRRIADEVLRQVKDVLDGYVKTPNDIDGGLVQLQVEVDTVIDRFVDAGEVFGEDTELIVEEGANDYEFNVTGTIRPVRSTIAINVNTTIA